MGIKGRRSYHRLDIKDFATVKTLLEAKLGVSKIHEITGRSFGVIGLIRKSNSLNDYRSEVKKITAKFSVKPVVVGEEAPQVSSETKSNTDRIVDELRNINASLERLALAWETRPIKKGLFDR